MTLVVRGLKTLVIIILLTSSLVSAFCEVQVFRRSVQELPFDQTAHFSRSCFHQKACALYVDIESDEAGSFCRTIPRIGNDTKVGEMNVLQARSFVIGDPAKPSFATVTGRGSIPTYIPTYTVTNSYHKTELLSGGQNDGNSV